MNIIVYWEPKSSHRLGDHLLVTCMLVSPKGRRKPVVSEELPLASIFGTNHPEVVGPIQSLRLVSEHWDWISKAHASSYGVQVHCTPRAAEALRHGKENWAQLARAYCRELKKKGCIVSLVEMN